MSIHTPAGVVARRSAEEVVRERQAREETKAQAQREQRHREYDEQMAAQAQRCVDLRSQIMAAIPVALKRLARKEWKNGVLQEVFTWDGTFVVVKRKRNVKDFFFHKMNKANYESVELAAWDIGREAGPGKHRNINLWLLSSGHLARLADLELETGQIEVREAWKGVTRRWHLTGLYDNQKVVEDWLNGCDEATLTNILRAIESL